MDINKLDITKIVLGGAIKVFFKIVLTIFICEALVMVFFDLVQVEEKWVILIDPFILAILSAPILYYFIIKPVKDSLEQRQIAFNEIEDLTKGLREKLDDMEKLLHIVTHDIKVPLINLDGYSQELVRSCKDIKSKIEEANIDGRLKKILLYSINTDIGESLRFIRTSTERVDCLIKNLTKLAATGRKPLDVKKLDVDQIVENVISNMKYQATKVGATIEQEHLPECFGDELQVSQVFSNLISNALKFLNPQRKGLIKISGHIDKNSSVYCVEDNGIGIEPDKLSKIFEVFYRVEENESQGEGLGLNIIKQIVEHHKGRVWVESEKGKGSRFLVSLPCVEDALLTTEIKG